MLKCLLFDLDGLLVDSEPLQFRSYQHALNRFGVQLDLDAWIQWHAVEASPTRWIKDQGLEIDPEEVRSVKKEHYERLIDLELQLKSGAKELVENCAEEFDLAVVSSSRRESIEACLKKFNLRDKFSTIVSSAVLARSKPYPDSYLEALKLMNVAPENAMALEDSVTGFKAASAANLICVVCPDYFIPKSNDAFAGAALIVESLDELSPQNIRAVHANKLAENEGET